MAIWFNRQTKFYQVYWMSTCLYKTKDYIQAVKLACNAAHLNDLTKWK